MTTSAEHTSTVLADRFSSIVGAGHVLVGEAERTIYSHDAHQPGVLAEAVVRPGSADEVAAVVAAAKDLGMSIVPRGGGMSYTAGCVPSGPGSILLDIARLDQILEINEADGYVIVGAGCTWGTLREVLGKRGLRTPFWGPVSGRYATVGGSVSQNTVMWGSTANGSTADIVTGLEVVLADGTLLRTGSWAFGKPFFRNFGPDLTGIFLNDTGAMAVKTAVALRLERIPDARRFATFQFEDRASYVEAIAEVSRSRLATTAFGMDPTLQGIEVREARLVDGATRIPGLMAASGGGLRGLKEVAKAAVAGRRVAVEGSYALHVVIEALSDAAAEVALAKVRDVCATGTEVNGSVPAMMFGSPFVDISAATGPTGERMLPQHGVFAFSDTLDAWAAMDAAIAPFQEELAARSVDVGVLTFPSGTGMIVEFVFYWHDGTTPWHQGKLDKRSLAQMGKVEKSPETTALVDRASAALRDAMRDAGAAHLQIARRYHYLSGMEKATADLLVAIKEVVDPDQTMNPGSLGLDAPYTEP